MTTYDFERPFVSAESIELYEALDAVVSARYGRTVRATKLSNIEYKIRFNRLGQTNNMKPPPSTGRIFMGYLVVRKLGTVDQYETWIPEDAFDESTNPLVWSVLAVILFVKERRLAHNGENMDDRHNGANAIISIQGFDLEVPRGRTP